MSKNNNFRKTAPLLKYISLPFFVLLAVVWISLLGTGGDILAPNYSIYLIAITFIFGVLNTILGVFKLFEEGFSVVIFGVVIISVIFVVGFYQLIYLLFKELIGF